VAYKRITVEQENQMIEMYLDGKTQPTIAKVIGCHAITVGRTLRARNIELRDPYFCNERCKVDDSFFDTIDTEAKAYWLGFITADGCVRKNKVRIGLNAKDQGHLRKFLDDIGSEVSIGISSQKNGELIMASVEVSSRQLYNALKTHGIFERKSFTVEPCSNVPEELQRHYWRGVLDGDGTISKSVRGKYDVWTIALYGNLAMVSGFRDFIGDKVGSKATVFPKKNIFRMGYSGTNVPQRVADILYKDATVYLERKKILANNIRSLKEE
jgi:intein-encoded DNA endonuclease-like protein